MIAIFYAAFFPPKLQKLNQPKTKLKHLITICLDRRMGITKTDTKISKPPVMLKYILKFQIEPQKRNYNCQQNKPPAIRKNLGG